MSVTEVDCPDLNSQAGEAVLDCLLQWRPVPYYSLQDELSPLSILSDHHSR
jgi:hypothetical protein